MSTSWVFLALILIFKNWDAIGAIESFRFFMTPAARGASVR